MKTIYWILIGVAALAISVIATVMIVKERTKKDEEEVIDEAVKRLMYGGTVGDIELIGQMHYCKKADGSLYYTSGPCPKGMTETS